MTIKDEAREYAVRVVENEISRIEQAYLDGYNTAKAKYCNEAIVDEEYKTVTVEGKTSNPIKWIDLSLPSGTQWSYPVEYSENGKNCIFNLTYNQVKNLSIPTIEDIIELKEYTDKILCPRNIGHKSIDGKILELSNKMTFWLNDLENDPKYRKSANAQLEVTDRFMGNGSYLILVKRKK